MCGRMNIISDPLCQLVSDTLGIVFQADTNNDLCPSQKVSTIAMANDGYQQLDTTWGIQPNWSKRLLINAQSESVSQKSTFKQAFQTNRCLVPCSGWYEWRTEGAKKVKYLFSHGGNMPIYMAGIYYQAAMPQLVTLTIAPNQICQQYHKRMPLLISPQHIDYWFHSPVAQLHCYMPCQMNQFR